jgi:hypothetical protein
LICIQSLGIFVTQTANIFPEFLYTLIFQIEYRILLRNSNVDMHLLKPLPLIVSGLLIVAFCLVPVSAKAAPITHLWCSALRSSLVAAGVSTPPCGLLNGLLQQAFNNNGQFVSFFPTTVGTFPPYQQQATNNYPLPTILSQSAYTDSIGTVHIVGEVINQSPVTAKFVQITATFYDANNQVVGTDFTFTQPSDLAPGQRAPFDILVLSGGIPMNQVRNYALSVS